MQTIILSNFKIFLKMSQYWFLLATVLCEQQNLNGFIYHLVIVPFSYFSSRPRILSKALWTSQNHFKTRLSAIQQKVASSLSKTVFKQHLLTQSFLGSKMRSRNQQIQIRKKIWSKNFILNYLELLDQDLLNKSIFE